ncbi:hypothetical protein [Stappia sp. ES.058]|uniref:hypothetical protein n=1 Tax=Stappia sp. ES.058 TaxID=1881061 RepID=UPI00087928D4|nr:hypothetical protein [Stappia sp. ES.058]SDT99724.1 hypothetical protein SAMN05428979_1001 [Stappia sp. ES.058]
MIDIPVMLQRTARGAVPRCGLLAIAMVLAGPPAGLADSGPEPDACSLQAAAHADQATPRGVNGEDVAAAAIDGATIGGLAGPGPAPGGWSVRGARRGARLGGGLATLNALNAPKLDDWQRSFDAAYTACISGQPMPGLPDSRCPPSTGVVTGSGQGGLYGASSRRNCR